MSKDYDWAMEAVLLEDLPPETEGAPQYRERIKGSLERCFDHARTMTPEGRRKLHIETADGGRIEAAEIAAYFGDEAADPVALKPTDLV